MINERDNGADEALKCGGDKNAAVRKKCRSLRQHSWIDRVSFFFLSLASRARAKDRQAPDK